MMMKDNSGATAFAGGAALLVGAVIAVVFFQRFTPSGEALGRLLWPLSAAVLILLASLAAGTGCAAAARRSFARIARLPPGEAGVDTGNEVLLGVPAYGTLVGVLAWASPAGVLAPAVILATLALAAVGGLRLLRTWQAPRWRLEVSAAVLLGVPILFAAIEAISPVSSPDELVYKLAVSHTYLIDGGMVEMPFCSQSYFPAALSLSSLGALLFSGAGAARLVFLAVYLLTLRVVFRVAERMEPRMGPWATAVLAWTPALMLVGGWCWVDWGLIGLLLLSYEAWDRFCADPNAQDAAFCSGALAFALGSRYSAAPWLLLFALAVAIRGRRLPVARLRTILVGAALLVLLGGFFYLRNVVWTGSPVAPFLLPASPLMSHYRSDGQLSGWQELVRGYDILHPGIIDDSLGILMPFAVLASPFALARRRRFGDLFAIGVVQLIAFVTFAPTSRLMITAVVPLALLGCSALVALARRAGRILRTLLVAGSGIALAGQALLVAYILVVSYDFLPYLVGSESAQQYLDRTRDFARPYRFLSDRTPEDARVLLLGENRTLYLERRSIAAGNLDGPRIAAYLSRFPDAAAFDAEMRRTDVSYILRHRPWYRVSGGQAGPPANMLEKEYVLEVSRETDAMLADFLATRARLEYRDATDEIYRLTR